MQRGVYRLTDDIIAIFDTEGRKVVRIIKRGAMLSIDSEILDDPRLILATWKDETVTVFRADLDERSELLFLP